MQREIYKLKVKDQMSQLNNGQKAPKKTHDGYKVHGNENGNLGEMSPFQIGQLLYTGSDNTC